MAAGEIEHVQSVRRLRRDRTSVRCFAYRAGRDVHSWFDRSGSGNAARGDNPRHACPDAARHASTGARGHASAIHGCARRKTARAGRRNRDDAGYPRDQEEKIKAPLRPLRLLSLSLSRSVFLPAPAVLVAVPSAALSPLPASSAVLLWSAV